MIPESALAAVPGVVDREPPPRITPLPGGLVNRAFLVETGAGRFVLRLNGDAQQARALGVDRRAEIEAQRLAAAAALAPRVVAHAADHAFLVSEFVAGERLDAAALATPAGLQRLGATLRGMRRLEPSGSTVATLAAGVALIERARRLVAHALERATPGEAAPLRRVLESAEQGWRVAGGGTRAPCLVHSDPTPGNVLRVAGRPTLVLLDWEYAHLGDPLQDAAVWWQACPALRGEGHALLEACGLAAEVDARMLAGMASVYAAIDRAWHHLAENAAGIPPGGRAN